LSLNHGVFVSAARVNVSITSVRAYRYIDFFVKKTNIDRIERVARETIGRNRSRV
jgi:hypothetical protein